MFEPRRASEAVVAAAVECCSASASSSTDVDATQGDGAADGGAIGNDPYIEGEEGGRRWRILDVVS